MKSIELHTEASKDSSPAASHNTDIDWNGAAGSITESESDGFPDNVSMISDNVSLSSKALKKHDIKKLLASMHKLKQENTNLRDSLDRMNATDVALLIAKLRASHADVQRLKQHNLELKDRIQDLENMFINATFEHVGSRPSTQERIRSKLAQHHTDEHPAAEISHDDTKGIDVFIASSSIESPHSVVLEQQLRLWQRKHKHAEKLAKSFEVKMQLMQDEMAAMQSTAKVAGESSSSASITTQSAVSFQPQSGGKTRKMYTEEELKADVESRREADQRTIRALAQEVKRLVAMLPRQLIDSELQDQQQQQQQQPEEQGRQLDQDQLASESTLSPFLEASADAEQSDAAIALDPILSPAPAATSYPILIISISMLIVALVVGCMLFLRPSQDA